MKKMLVIFSVGMHALQAYPIKEQMQRQWHHFKKHLTVTQAPVGYCLSGITAGLLLLQACNALKAGNAYVFYLQTMKIPKAFTVRLQKDIKGYMLTLGLKKQLKLKIASSSLFAPFLNYKKLKNEYIKKQKEQTACEETKNHNAYCDVKIVNNKNDPELAQLVEIFLQSYKLPKSKL